ncbi:hypothetical protein, partial [Saccharopolyspora sp. NPDC003762]
FLRPTPMLLQGQDYFFRSPDTPLDFQERMFGWPPHRWLPAAGRRHRTRHVPWLRHPLALRPPAAARPAVAAAASSERRAWPSAAA